MFPPWCHRVLAAGYAARDECGRAKESLTVCMSFVTDLTFASVPENLARVVGGEAGFAILARIFADTARRIYSRVRAACCPDSTDPTLLFRRLEYVSALIGSNGYPARASVERSNGSIRLVFSNVGHMRNGSIIYAAPIVGVIAGMIEAMGLKTRILSDGSRLHLADGDAYRVYPARVAPGEVEVVVVPPAGEA